MKQKFLLYFLIAIAIVAVFAFAIYQLVYRAGAPATSGTTGQTGSLPSAVNQQFPSPSGNQT